MHLEVIWMIQILWRSSESLDSLDQFLQGIGNPIGSYHSIYESTLCSSIWTYFHYVSIRWLNYSWASRFQTRSTSHIVARLSIESSDFCVIEISPKVLWSKSVLRFCNLFHFLTSLTFELSAWLKRPSTSWTLSENSANQLANLITPNSIR